MDSKWKGGSDQGAFEHFMRPHSSKGCLVRGGAKFLMRGLAEMPTSEGFVMPEKTSLAPPYSPGLQKSFLTGAAVKHTKSLHQKTSNFKILKLGKMAEWPKARPC